jgi:hypothetical protein
VKLSTFHTYAIRLVKYYRMELGKEEKKFQKINKIEDDSEDGSWNT